MLGFVNTGVFFLVSGACQGRKGCAASREVGILPLPYSVVARRAATEVAPFCVGAAIIARILGGRALVHVVAGTGELVKGKA